MKDSTPGKMYGNDKTHKIGNPTRVITSGCNTVIGNLSVFVENNLNSLDLHQILLWLVLIQ